MDKEISVHKATLVAVITGIITSCISGALVAHYQYGSLISSFETNIKNYRDDLEKKIQLLDSNIIKLNNENGKLKDIINNQAVLIDKMRYNLNYIYLYSDVSSYESWKKSISDNKNRVSKDLNFPNN